MTNTFLALSRALQRLRPAEAALVGFSVALLSLDLVWSQAADRAVAWAAFAPGVFVALALIVVGGFARGRFPDSGLGTCSVGLGIFAAVCLAVSILVLVLLPLPSPLMDNHLIAFDAMMGFDWDAFVLHAKEFPLAVETLRYVYGSAIPQIALLIVILSVTSRESEMQRLLFCGSFSLVVAVAIWWLFPSIGPAPMSALSSDPAVQDMLYHSPREARILLNLVTSGPEIAVPGQLLGGLVAFPSIHMVMALMVAWYSRGTWAFFAFCVSSLLMIPATLLHGGHHLSDLFGGLALFALAVSLARWLVRDPKVVLQVPSAQAAIT